MTQVGALPHPGAHPFFAGVVPSTATRLLFVSNGNRAAALEK